MTKAQQLIRIKNEYRAEHGNSSESLRRIIDWAIETKRLELDLAKARSRAIEELGAALRSEVVLDADGNEVRVNLAFETDQGWLWDERTTISRQHMELNVAQNRRMQYADIRALARSVNDYNDRHPNEPPIQYSLNFAADLADEGIKVPSSILPPPPLGQSPSAGSGTVSRRARFNRADRQGVSS